MVILSLLAAWAGRYATSQNHPELGWHTLTTEHFAIHYPRSRRRGPEHPRYIDAESTAQQLAARADDLWLRICRAVEHYPSERIHIMVLETTDRLEGFTLTQQGWIVLSSNPGPELARMRGRSGWVPDLLAHELAHVITLKKAGWFEEKTSSFGVEVGGLAESGFHQLGGAIPIEQDEPFWWSEGAAEYASELAQVNWWTSSRSMTLRTMVLEDRLLNDVEWNENQLLGGWFESERAYQQGYGFHRWFAERYGHDAWLEVMERSAKHLQLDWTSVYQKVVGVDAAALKQLYEDELRAEATAFVETREQQGLVEGTEVATWALGWTTPSFRGQDRWAMVERDEQHENRERTGTMTLHSSFSTDGRWFGRQRSGWLEVRRMHEDFWTVFAGGVPDWDLTDAQRDRSSAMSAWLPSRYLSDFDFIPGADALVMVGMEDAHRSKMAPEGMHWTRLYRVDLSPIIQHGQERLPEEMRSRLQPIPGTLRASDPSVSPDGQWLAYVVFGRGSQNLVVSRLDGSERRLLTNFSDGSWVQGTDWSPDGTQIVSAVHRHHQQNLWIFEVKTGTGEPMMSDGWEELDPYWAADGSIWFSADVDEVFDIFRWDPAGRFTRMTRVVTGATSPALTPDGKLLYHHFTAWGWKTHGIRTSELAWEDATTAFGTPQPDGPSAPSPSVPSRAYQPHRALTSLGFAPSFRLDRAHDGTVLPRLGLYIKLRDAAETNSWTFQGWIGADALVRGRWENHLAWPDLILHGSHWAGRLPDSPRPRQLTTGGARVRLPWREDLWAELGWYGFVVRERNQQLQVVHQSSVLEARLHLGDAERLERDDLNQGGAADIVVTRGTSQGQQKLTFHRIEADAQWVFEAPADDHRWVLQAALSATDRPVEPDDALQIGGDHSYALRPGRVQSTLPFPGYAPYALTAQHLGKFGMDWRLPLGVELREELGPWILHTLMLGIGGDAGVAIEGRTTTILVDGRIDLRLGSSLLGSRFNTLLRFAYGRKLEGGLGGPRVIVAIGSGF